MFLEDRTLNTSSDGDINPLTPGWSRATLVIPLHSRRGTLSKACWTRPPENHLEPQWISWCWSEGKSRPEPVVFPFKCGKVLRCRESKPQAPTNSRIRNWFVIPPNLRIPPFLHPFIFASGTNPQKEIWWTQWRWVRAGFDIEYQERCHDNKMFKLTAFHHPWRIHVCYIW